MSIKGSMTWLTSIALCIIHGMAVAQSVPYKPPPSSQANVKPQSMIVMSNDHQLFYKAYTDFSDLDGDGEIDDTYKDSIRYYGYFDSEGCYEYETDLAGGAFQRGRDTDDDFECNRDDDDDDDDDDDGGNYWSGNFLNWATMTRMDILRKVLYGGKRYRDSTTESTILERAFLPLDAHSFAKVIEDNDVIEDNTPFDEGEITICNTTYAASGASKDITGAPLIRVARGRWPRWSANERWQCVWRNEKGQGIQGDRPREGDEGLGRNNYRARVEVCVSDDGTPCENYPGSDYDKPVGLLHEYASSIDFGLISGSYAKNRSGGVLRSNVRSFLEELDVATGVFKPDVSGIVSNIDAFRVSRYSFSSGTYDGDSCGFGKKAEDFGNGECSSWGNPLAEMTLEAIRYLTGETSPMSGFSVGSGVVEESYVAGLTSPAWTGNDSNDWCAAHSMVLMNASEASFDADELGGWTRLAASGIEASTDDVGEEEGLAGAYFIGEAGSNVNKQCTAKDIVGLGGVQGICPTAPGLEGSYHVAGLAKYAYENLVVKDPDDDAQGNNISTYAVRLSSNIPEIRVRVRDDDDDDDWDGDGDDWGNDGWDGGQQNDRVITIVPACESYSTGDQVSGSGRNINPNRIGKCAIVDFRVSESDDEDDDDRDGRGSFDVIWEDSEFGGDYDSDLVMTLEYRIDGNNLRIRTDVDNQSTSQIMGVGYIVSGTEDDGFHVHSGINGYDRYECGGNGNGNGNGSGNDECRINDGDSEQRYRISDSSSGNFLRPPLYYAAGYGNDGVNEDGSPSAYFEVSRVGELVDSLQEVLDQVLRSSARSGSGLGFSASSGDTLFQTIYNNVNSWSGDLLAFSISDEGVSSTPLWSARKAMPSPDERTIIAWLYGDGRPFRMQGELEPYVNYLRGDPQDEQRNGGFLRNRLWLDGSAAPLGDIVGSQPYYAGRPDTYHVPAENDTSYAEFRTAYSGRTPVVYVGANDGMLHGFNAETGEELLAYIPGILLEAEPNYGALARLIDPNYLHRYYVDGSPTVLDVRLDGEWISLLASGLGSGGKGIFALDVTDPSAFSEDADNAAKIALWEFGPKDDEKLNGGEHLGFVYDRPSIVQLENGDHAVVFGNGYFSESGKASLYILPVDAYEEDDGEWEWDKDEVIRLTPGHVANAGLNGLSSVSMIDSDDNGRMDLAYAGDLQGNVWRFDLSDDSASEWDEDGNISLLFRAASAGGTAQVITTGPEVGAHPEGGVMLYFGTGGPEGESTPTSQSHDTLYAIRDRAPFEPTSPLGRDDLSERDLVTSNAEIRYFPLGNTYGEDTSTWGWFVDLPDHERAVSRPLLRGDRIIFTTLIPGIGLCGAEDEGYLYELKAHSGAAPNRPLIDTNGDGQINAGDTLSVDGSQVVPVGVKTEGALFTPVVRSDDSGKREVKVSVNTAGDIQRIVEQSLNRLRLGRASWRILE